MHSNGKHVGPRLGERVDRTVIRGHQLGQHGKHARWCYTSIADAWIQIRQDAGSNGHESDPRSWKFIAKREGLRVQTAPLLSFLQRVRVESMHGVDRVVAFPYKDQLRRERNASAHHRQDTDTLSPSHQGPHHVRIRRRAGGVRQHLVLRHRTHVRVVVLEPLVRAVG